MISAESLQVILFTLRVCALSTACILPPALALAWLLARRSFPGQPLLETFLSLPLVMPPVATGLILLRLLGRNGPVGGFLEGVLHFEVVFTWKAVVVATAVMSFPLLLRSARTAFQEVPPRLEEVARTLGAGEWRVFHSITLPLAARGIMAGLVLAFARALGEFGATILVAGNIPGRTQTLALSIYEAVQLGDDRRAFGLLAVAVVVAFAAVWGSEWILRAKRGAA